MYHALIMAGGSGTRMWPLSRKSKPKQALPLVDAQRSMVQITVDRLQPLITSERVHIVTNAEMAAIFREQLPNLPTANFIIEPSARDSGPAAALGLAHIHRIDPDATVAVLAADHHIAKQEQFRRVLADAALAARAGYIVTLGIHATEASTGFGYVERGAQLPGFDAATHPIYKCERFTEKPKAEVAQAYLAGGKHSWNSGMFILSATVGLAEFSRQHHDFAGPLAALEAAVGQPGYPAALDAAWQASPRKSIDFAIMEGAQKLAVIPVDLGWSDIGSWASLLEVLSADEHGNVVMGEHISIDTRGSLVRGGNRIIATVGVSDLIVIDTPDALLICPKDRVQDVKTVVEQLKTKQLNHVL